MTSCPSTNVVRNSLSPLSSFRERLNHAVALRGVTKAWLAEQLTISPQAFNHLLRRAPKPDRIEQLSQLLQVSSTWLASGDGPICTVSTVGRTNLPILDYHDIKTWLKTQTFPTDRPSTPVNGPNDVYIAYVLPNDALFPPFLEHSILIFRRDQTPHHGDYVLIETHAGEILVRRWQQDGDSVLLKASHADYRIIAGEDVHILIGVLYEARYRLGAGH